MTIKAKTNNTLWMFSNGSLCKKKGTDDEKYSNNFFPVNEKHENTQ